MKQEINLVGFSGNELIIREGQALDQQEPRVKSINGIIDTPLRWIKARKSEVNLANSHVIVDRDKAKITLVINDFNHYQDTIAGALEFHPMFLKFGINKGKYITAFEMAELIKMNRSFFETHAKAAELVSALKNLKAKVQQNIEKADNSRGDKTQIFQQTVETNVPTEFTLVLPIFKGQEKQTFRAEVYFNPADSSCTLVSPEANDITVSVTDSIIDEQLNAIIEEHPGLTIIEI